MILDRAQSVCRLMSRASVLAFASAVLLTACADDETRLAEFMSRGDAYIESGETKEAIIEFKNALQIDPNFAAAHEALSLAYLAETKPREAYWEMSETVRLDPENVEGRLRFGTVSLAIGEKDVAGEQAEAILKIESKEPRAHLLRAQVRTLDEDFEGAERDFKSAIEIDQSAPAYRFLYAGFLEGQARGDESLEIMRQLVELEPSYIALANYARIIARTEPEPAVVDALMARTIEAARKAPEKAEDVETPSRAIQGGKTSLLESVNREEAVQAAHLLKSAYLFEAGRVDESLATLDEGTQHLEDKTQLIYQMARINRALGKNDEADALLVRAADEAPNSARPHLVLSAFLGQQQELEGALKAALSAVEAEPTNTTARLREAELRVDIGYRDNDQAGIQAGRAIVDGVLGEEPSNPEANFVRAKIELAADDVKAAIESLLTVLETRPDWAEARFVLGSSLAVSGQNARARAELNRAIGLDPTLKDARKLLTQMHAQLGEHEFAIEQGRAYLEQVPGDHAVRIIVAQSLIRVGQAKTAFEEVSKIPEDERDAGAEFALGRLDLAFGRPEQAKARLLRAHEMAPQNAPVLETLLAIDRQSNQIADSEKRIEEAAKLAPDNSEIAELQAQVALLKEDVDGSKLALARAIELDSQNLSAQLALADLERRLGNEEGMVSVLEGAAAAMPNSADLKYRLGLVYQQRGENQKAVAVYDQAIALDGTNGSVKNNLAYLLADIPGGDLDRALELAQEAKELMPDDPNAADTLGWVLLKRGVPSAAIGYLEEAVVQLPDEAFEPRGVVQNHLAEAYEKNEEAGKATDASKQVLSNYERMLSAAKERGLAFPEPDWVGEARDRIARLGGKG